MSRDEQIFASIEKTWKIRIILMITVNYECGSRRTFLLCYGVSWPEVDDKWTMKISGDFWSQSFCRRWVRKVLNQLDMKMADPMNALNNYQNNVDAYELDPDRMVDGFLRLQGPKGNGFTVEFIKIVDREVQALAIFALEEPINGVPRFSVGYAVANKHRRRGLGFEAITIGIKELKRQVRAQNVSKFYVEALISNTNQPSIGLAKKIFSEDGVPNVDAESGTPSLLFYKLIQTSKIK